MTTPHIDTFASTLLEEAKRFLEKTGSDDGGQEAYLHAALMLGFCALEAHVNAIGDDFAGQKAFTPHELGIMQEKVVRLEGGEFQLTPRLQMVRLDERIQFLHRKFSGTPIDKAAPWWTQLQIAMELRNQLTHPKDVPTITREGVGRALQAIIDTLNVVYRAVYGVKFPAAVRGLHSKLDF
ncbi:MAG TPA: hypothetical protein VF121_16220 [Thermoanaerobaculia bacterium]|nr:hypothetical protein [Thermoanaerobaculia bacterium]